MMKRLIRISNGHDCGEYPDAHEPPIGCEEYEGLNANPPTFRYDPIPGPTPEQIAAQQAEQQRTQEIEAAINGDTTIASLKAMTNAEFDTWWLSNVTTLAQANNILKRLTRLAIRRLV